MTDLGISHLTIRKPYSHTGRRNLTVRVIFEKVVQGRSVGSSYCIGFLLRPQSNSIQNN